jgi:hypothetical protein
VNSFDHQNENKVDLWDYAFKELGQNISYHNSFLIDDSLTWVDKFIELGGKAHQYSNDNDFNLWQGDIC